ncbi:hypothetical protein AWZ03_006896 [Drosophila navojoa]|uniref:Uncharacterized protein n=1 Tax=Drosophila navojoa TaxID=7232 RepID=A0A484BCZ2_DRONA|nr:hypothetical protein AWZ03_006896 [Drosophila navojoa]
MAADATAATATIAAEVKQQSIKVSDYRRGTPECLLPMPAQAVSEQNRPTPHLCPRRCPAPPPCCMLPAALPIHAAHDEDALCCKLKAGRPIIEPTADQAREDSDAASLLLMLPLLLLLRRQL